MTTMAEEPTRAEWRSAEERAVTHSPAPVGRAMRMRADRLLVGDHVAWKDGTYQRVIATWHAQGLSVIVSAASTMLLHDNDRVTVKR